MRQTTTTSSSFSTSTFRAGTNLKDPTRSGYARVSVIDQQDLFPNEGYEFPDQRHKPPTNSYRISADSPFNTNYKHSSAWKEPQSNSIANCMSNMMRTEHICNRVAVKAIAAPTDGELRPLYSKIAQQAIEKDRQVQLRMREQMRLQKMKEDDYWAQVEQEQGEKTKEVERQYINSIRSSQKALADDYQEQFRLHKKREDAEKQELKEEAEKIKKIQEQEHKEELKRQERIRQENAEKAKEFQILNDQLLQRKQRKIEEDLKQEAITMKQHEESERRQDERNNFLKKRREEKNKIRERLIDQQSKKLAEIHAKQQKDQNVAESEIAKREEMERQKKITKQREQALQRKNDYEEFLRTKDLKKSTEQVEPDFALNDDEEARKFDEQMKAQERRKVMRLQMAQAAERRERERRERIDEITQARANKDTMFFLKDNEW